jgi:RecA-family ATPase
MLTKAAQPMHDASVAPLVHFTFSSPAAQQLQTVLKTEFLRSGRAETIDWQNQPTYLER